jgi:hypothetical protein
MPEQELKRFVVPIRDESRGRRDPAHSHAIHGLQALQEFREDVVMREGESVEGTTIMVGVVYEAVYAYSVFLGSCPTGLVR